MPGWFISHCSKRFWVRDKSRRVGSVWGKWEKEAELSCLQWHIPLVVTNFCSHGTLAFNFVAALFFECSHPGQGHSKEIRVMLTLMSLQWLNWGRETVNGCHPSSKHKINGQWQYLCSWWWRSWAAVLKTCLHLNHGLGKGQGDVAQSCNTFTWMHPNTETWGTATTVVDDLEVRQRWAGLGRAFVGLGQQLS